jgi:hypothetical protein
VLTEMNIKRLLIVVAAVFGMASPSLAASTIVELTQTGCQFLEPEGTDHGFTTRAYADCERINKRTGEKRLAQSKTLELAAGEYVFRVHNKNVPYVLGFWLRGEGLGRVTLPGVSGGGIQTGGYKDYSITLEAGEYLYSCPLNPTPDYRLLVNP